MNQLTKYLLTLNKEANAALSRAEKTIGMYSENEGRINDLPADKVMVGLRSNVEDQSPYLYESFRTVDGSFQFYERPF